MMIRIPMDPNLRKPGEHHGTNADQMQAKNFGWSKPRPEMCRDKAEEAVSIRNTQKNNAIHSAKPEVMSRSLNHRNISRLNSTPSSTNVEKSQAQPMMPSICSYDRALEVFQTVARMPTNENEVGKWHSDLVKRVNALVEQTPL